jgi:hypothetical protein
MKAAQYEQARDACNDAHNNDPRDPDAGGRRPRFVILCDFEWPEFQNLHKPILERIS